MIAYFNKATAKTPATLVVCAKPCNGAEYSSATRIEIAGKREARAYCKANGIKPWNF